MQGKINPDYPSTHDYEGRKVRIDHRFARMPVEKSHSNERLSDAYNEGYRGAIPSRPNYLGKIPKGSRRSDERS